MRKFLAKFELCLAQCLGNTVTGLLRGGEPSVHSCHQFRRCLVMDAPQARDHGACSIGREASRKAMKLVRALAGVQAGLATREHDGARGRFEVVDVPHGQPAVVHSQAA